MQRGSYKTMCSGIENFRFGRRQPEKLSYRPTNGGQSNCRHNRLTKLYVRQAAVCLERCCTSDLLETEVRERNATSSRLALVASTTACRVQTVGPRLLLSA